MYIYEGSIAKLVRALTRLDRHYIHTHTQQHRHANARQDGAWTGVSGRHESAVDYPQTSAATAANEGGGVEGGPAVGNVGADGDAYGGASARMPLRQVTAVLHQACRVLLKKKRAARSTPRAVSNSPSKSRG